MPIEVCYLGGQHPHHLTTPVESEIKAEKERERAVAGPMVCSPALKPPLRGGVSFGESTESKGDGAWLIHLFTSS